MSYGNLINRVMESSKQVEPKVGDGCTITMFSDRHAGTIVKVTKCQIHVQRDIATIVKGNIFEGAEYTYERNPNAPVEVFRKTKRGWRCNGSGLLIGHRDEYYDPCF
jgi:hypothetical protein